MGVGYGSMLLSSGCVFSLPALALFSLSLIYSIADVVVLNEYNNTKHKAL
jgi:hypothetical protein